MLQAQFILSCFHFLSLSYLLKYYLMKAFRMQHTHYYYYFIILENCLDRHAEKDPNKIALIWERDEPGKTLHVSYRYG